MAKKRNVLEDMQPVSYTDTRSDSTFKGYHEGMTKPDVQESVNPLLHPIATAEGLAYAGLAGILGKNTNNAFYDGFNKSMAGLGGKWIDSNNNIHYNPQGGVAPTPSISPLSSAESALEKVRAMKEAKLLKEAAKLEQKKALNLQRSLRMRNNNLAVGHSTEKAQQTRIANNTTQVVIGEQIKNKYKHSRNMVSKPVIVTTPNGFSTTSAKGSYYNKNVFTANDLNLLK